MLHRTVKLSQLTAPVQDKQPGQVQTLQRLAVPHLALEVFPMRRQLVLEVDRGSVTYLEGSCQAQQGPPDQPVGSCWLQRVVAALCAQPSHGGVLDLQADHLGTARCCGVHSQTSPVHVAAHRDFPGKECSRAACPRVCLLQARSERSASGGLQAQPAAGAQEQGDAGAPAPSPAAAAGWRPDASSRIVQPLYIGSGALFVEQVAQPAGSRAARRTLRADLQLTGVRTRFEADPLVAACTAAADVAGAARDVPPRAVHQQGGVQQGSSAADSPSAAPADAVRSSQEQQSTLARLADDQAAPALPASTADCQQQRAPQPDARLPGKPAGKAARALPVVMLSLTLADWHNDVTVAPSITWGLALPRLQLEADSRVLEGLKLLKQQAAAAAEQRDSGAENSRRKAGAAEVDASLKPSPVQPGRAGAGIPGSEAASAETAMPSSPPAQPSLLPGHQALPRLLAEVEQPALRLHRAGLSLNGRSLLHCREVQVLFDFFPAIPPPRATPPALPSGRQPASSTAACGPSATPPAVVGGDTGAVSSLTTPARTEVARSIVVPSPSDADDGGLHTPGSMIEHDLELEAGLPSGASYSSLVMEELRAGPSGGHPQAVSPPCACLGLDWRLGGPFLQLSGGGLWFSLAALTAECRTVGPCPTGSSAQRGLYSAGRGCPGQPPPGQAEGLPSQWHIAMFLNAEMLTQLPFAAASLPSLSMSARLCLRLLRLVPAGRSLAQTGHAQTSIVWPRNLKCIKRTTQQDPGAARACTDVRNRATMLSLVCRRWLAKAWQTPSMPSPQWTGCGAIWRLFAPPACPRTWK